MDIPFDFMVASTVFVFSVVMTVAGLALAFQPPAPQRASAHKCQLEIKGGFAVTMHPQVVWVVYKIGDSWKVERGVTPLKLKPANFTAVFTGLCASYQGPPPGVYVYRYGVSSSEPNPPYISPSGEVVNYGGVHP